MISKQMIEERGFSEDFLQSEQNQSEVIFKRMGCEENEVSKREMTRNIKELLEHKMSITNSRRRSSLQLKEFLSDDYLKDNDDINDNENFVEEYERLKNEMTRLNMNNHNLYSRKMTQLEQVFVYEDEYPLLNLRRNLKYLRRFWSYFCFKTIKHPLFEYTTLIVILVNCVVMTYQNKYTEDNETLKNFEYAFLFLYLVEMLIKISGLGFIMAKKSYLRDYWNVIDFTVMMATITSYLLPEVDDLNFSGFRSLRVLRPLKTISSVKSLKILLATMFSSLNMLFETLLILVFFIIIFAISGLQLFSGFLKYRCFVVETGKKNDQDILCGRDSCPVGNLCGKLLENPQWGLLSFDNVLYSMLQVFQCITMEGWSFIMDQLREVLSDIVCIYFVILVFICGFFLLNIVLAVIKSKFTEIQRDGAKLQIAIKQMEKNEEQLLPEDTHISLKTEEPIEGEKSKKNAEQLRIIGAHFNLLKRKFIYPLMQYVEIVKWRMEENTKFFQERENKFFMETQLKNKMKLFNKRELKKYDIKLSGELKNIMTYSLGMQRRSKNKENPKASEANIIKFKRPTKVARNSFIGRLSKNNPVLTAQQIFQGNDLGSNFFFPRKKADIKRHKRRSSSSLAPFKKEENKLIRKSRFAPPPDFQGSESESPSSNKKFNEISARSSVEHSDKNTGSSIHKRKTTTIFLKSENRGSIDKTEAPPIGYNSFLKEAVDKLQRSQTRIMLSSNRNDSLKKKGKKSVVTPLNGKSKELNLRKNLFNNYLSIDDIDNKHRQTVLNIIPPHYMTILFDHSKEYLSSSYEEVLPLKKENEEKEKIYQQEKAIKSKKYPFVYKLLDPPNFSQNLDSAKEKALISVHRGSRSRPNSLKNISFNNFLVSERRNFPSGLESVNGSFLNERRSRISKLTRKVDFNENGKGTTLSKKISFNNFQILQDPVPVKKLDENSRIASESFSKNSLLVPIPEPSPGRKRALTRIPKYEELARILNNRIDLEQIEKAQKEYDEIDYCSIYTRIRKNDMDSGKVSSHHWSGKDVLENRKYPYYHFNHIFKTLMNYSINIWIPGYKGLHILLRRNFKKIISHPLFERLIIISVVFNTIVLSLNGLVEVSDDLDSAQLFVTFIFLFEMMLKLYVLGVYNYLRDNMNIIDGTVVVLSISEMALSGPSGSGGAIGAFRAVRVFRVFRVLRLTKILRALSFMKVIIMVVSKCLQSFIYIALLLLLFIFVYALIGREIFGGKLGFQKDVRQNFDDSFNSILTIFQIMTLENWPDIFFVCLRSQVQPPITAAYILSWILIGNYILLNLFLAILLDSFTSEDVLVEMKKNDDDDEVIDLPKRKLTYIDTKALFASTIMEEFKKEDENYSLFIFSNKNPFRKMTKRFMKSKLFENFVLFTISMSSIKLAMDTYIEQSLGSDLVDIALNGIFISEAIIKVVSMGFLFGEKSYLREGWNVLDFLIIICSVIDMIVVNIDLPFLKIFRLIRLLRPLRFVSQNINMRIVVNALLESMSSIINVSIVILFLWLMFAIFGVSLLRGRMGYCKKNVDSDEIYNIGKGQCENELKRTWAIRDTNFENIISGVITLFIISSFESWPDIMFLTMDSNTEEFGPALNETWPMCCFFIVFIIVSSLFLMNLFTGAMFLHFDLARKKENFKGMAAFITEEQMKWINMQKMIIKAKPEFDMVKPPRYGLRLKIYKKITNNKFEYFIFICIIGNIILMSIFYDDAPEGYVNILEQANIAFSIIFIIESMVKIFAFSFKGYWFSRWNRFDFIVMLASIIDLTFETLDTSVVSFLKIGPQLARLFRVVRISRIFKLAKRFVGLQKLINTITFSLPSMLNVGALLVLIFFIYSILGCFLFAEIKKGDIIGQNINFWRFDFALLALFRILTGEGWQKIMFDLQRVSNCGEDFVCKALPVMYFISFNVICTFITMNFFVLIILQYFEEYNLKSDNPLESFHENLDSFRRVWTNYSYDYKGEKMYEKHLIDFFRALPPPLGMGPSESLQKVAREIMFMNITRDKDKCIYFNDLLFACLKRSYGEKMVSANNAEVIRVLLREEMKTKSKIQQIKIKRKKKQFSDKKVIPSLDEEAGETIVNPFFTILFVRMTFKVWLSYHQEIEKLKMFPDDHGPTHTFSRPISLESDEDDEDEYEHEVEYNEDDSDSGDDNSESSGSGSRSKGSDGNEENLLLIEAGAKSPTKEGPKKSTIKDKDKIMIINVDWAPEKGQIAEMQEEEDEGEKETQRKENEAERTILTEGRDDIKLKKSSFDMKIELLND